MAEVPDPRSYPKLADWAAAVHLFLKDQQELRPTPHFFSVLQAIDKAVENGIVQYDPVAERLVVSLNGAWEPLAIMSDI